MQARILIPIFALLGGIAARLAVAQTQEQEPGPTHAVAAPAKTKPQTLTAVQARAASEDPYAPQTAQLDSFGGGPLHSAPAAVLVLPRALLDARQPHSLSELVQSDAAVGDNYAPVGYYQNVAIRGFPLDLATGMRLNGLTTNGEQVLALENIEQVEIIKGIAGLESGLISPGGLVNYVSKRPAEVRTMTAGTDSRGSRYGALDLGHWFTPRFGLRFNTAYEGEHSYVRHDPGRRNVYSLAADGKISSKASLQWDGNYQTHAQRSVSGYQLLGGHTLPRHPDWHRLLGYEPWQKPVRIHSFNSTTRFRYRFADHWLGELDYAHSRSVIDDNIAFAYGCSYQSVCASGRAPGQFFAPNGGYDIYDWRSPDDTRRNDEGRAKLSGDFHTGPLNHQLVLGADAFRRRIVQHQALDDYVGKANIDRRDPPYYPPSPNRPGPAARALDSWQRAVFALDRIGWRQWQLLLGGRFVRLNESAFDGSGLLQRHTVLSRALPQTAVLWQPTSRLAVYVSFSKGLQLGRQAPSWTSNANSYLPPLIARQIETGLKYALSDSLELSTALYRLSQPYQWAKPDRTAAGSTYVQQGQETHQGIELNAEGQLSRYWHTVASLSYIHARASDAGMAGGHQLANIPRLRASLFAEYQLPAYPRLSINGDWRYSSANSADLAGRVRVPAYNLIDLGLTWHVALAGHRVTARLAVDNLFNHFYWRDTGSSGGDAYLFPGAPRVARFTVGYAL